MCSHFRGRSRSGENRADRWGVADREQLAMRLAQNYNSPEPGAWLDILDGLQRVPEGPGWIESNRVLLEALAGAIVYASLDDGDIAVS